MNKIFDFLKDEKRRTITLVSILLVIMLLIALLCEGIFYILHIFNYIAVILTSLFLVLNKYLNEKWIKITMYIISLLSTSYLLLECIILEFVFYDCKMYFCFILLGPLLISFCIYLFIDLIIILNRLIKDDIYTDDIALKDNAIIIKTKPGAVFIFPDDNKIYYNKNTININDITEIELINKNRVVAKSGMASALVAGVLFGGMGALAGAYAGKSEKLVETF